MPGLAEVVHEGRFVPQPEIGSRADAEGVHLPGRDFADAEETLYGQSGDESGDLLWGDGEQPVGFAVVRGDFRQHLVHGDARRGRETRFAADAGLDLARGERRRAQVRDVQKRFVERQRLHQLGVFAEYGPDLLRNGLVDFEAGRHEDQLRTEPPRRDGGEGRMHAEGARLVAGRGDHAPRTVVSHGDRTSPQGGVVALLDGGVEGVHVHVYDLPLRHIVRHLAIGRGGSSRLAGAAAVRSRPSAPRRRTAAPRRSVPGPPGCDAISRDICGSSRPWRAGR